MAPTLPIPSFGVASPPPPPQPVTIIVLSDDEEDDDIIHVSDDDIQAATSNHQQKPPSLAPGSSSLSASAEEEEEVQQPEEEEEEVAVRRMHVPCYRHWSFTDELNILEELARMSRGSVQFVWKQFFNALQKKGLRKGATVDDLRKKVRNLMNKFHVADEAGGPRGRGPRLLRDQELYQLSREIWPSNKRRS